MFALEICLSFILPLQKCSDKYEVRRKIGSSFNKSLFLFQVNVFLDKNVRLSLCKVFMVLVILFPLNGLNGEV